MLYLTGGLVLGETVALWMAAVERNRWNFFVCLGLVLTLLFSIGRNRKRLGRDTALFAFETAVFGGILGVAAMGTKTGVMESREAWLAAHRTESVSILGRIEEIAETDFQVRVLLGRCRAADGAKEVRDLGRMYGYFDRTGAAGLKIGMELAGKGTGKPADGPRNPGEFRYRSFCFSKGVCGSFSCDAILGTGVRYNALLESLRCLRRFLGGIFDRAATPKDAGIFRAALLGDRSGMEEELYERYRENGIAHLLAISGLHISLIGMGLWKLLRRCGLGFFLAGAVSVSFLVLYGLMVGGSASVERAVTMMALSFLAQWLGRTYDMLSALCAAAVLLLLSEPYLLTQAAFQLSFAAVGAIVLLAGPISEKLFPGRRGLAFFASLSIQLATAPILLYHSFEIPVYGVFLNLLVIPLMALVIWSGLATLALFPLWETAGILALGGGHFILAFYENLCLAAQRLPGATLTTGRPAGWQIAAYYGLLAAGAAFACKKGRTAAGELHLPGLAAGISLWLAGFLMLMPVPKGGLSVAFLDVGQGDGIFLRAGRDAVLVDCGSSQVKNLGDYRLEPFLKSQGVRKLSAVVVTHVDWDHMSAVRYLLEQDRGIGIGRLILSKAGEREEASVELERLAKARGIKTEYLDRGGRLVFGTKKQDADGASRDGAVMDCLSPPAGAEFSDKNRQSLVFLLRYGSFRMLLTGDVEAEGEERMARDGLLFPVTILKVAHHGSATSTTPELLKAVRPLAAVISYGEGNRYGHPSPDVTKRLSEQEIPIWETAKSGAVLVWTDGETVSMKGYVKDGAGGGQT